MAKARVNQAAINYHFKGKDGLYFELLKIAFEKLMEQLRIDPEKLKSLSREEALHSFVHQQLRPLLFRDELSLYIRIFAWEGAHPSKVFLKFMAKNTISYRPPPSTSCKCSYLRARIDGSPCAGHLADGPMQYIRAQP